MVIVGAAKLRVAVNWIESSIISTGVLAGDSSVFPLLASAPSTVAIRPRPLEYILLHTTRPQPSEHCTIHFGVPSDSKTLEMSPSVVSRKESSLRVHKWCGRSAHHFQTQAISSATSSTHLKCGSYPVLWHW